MAAETALDNQFYGFSVPVVMFDECSLQTANALSFPQGFILYGDWLAVKIILTTASTAGIAGTLAHEYAHQLQYRNGWQRPFDSTVRTTELEADAFSGLYMGLVKGFSTSTLQSYFAALASFGDYAFNSVSHHGTPAERVLAGLLGLAVANDMITHGSKPTFAQIHTLFVMTIGASSVSREVALSPEGRARIQDLLNGTIPNIPERGPDAARSALYPRN